MKKRTTQVNQKNPKRQLSIFEEVERALQPWPQPQHASKTQKFELPEFRKTSLRNVFFVCMCIVIFAGILLQYAPYAELDSYRPTEVYKSLTKRIQREINERAEYIDFERCIRKGGTIQEQDYCIFEGVRYTRPIDIALAQALQSLPKPLKHSEIDNITSGDSQLWWGYLNQYETFVSYAFITKMPFDKTRIAETSYYPAQFSSVSSLNSGTVITTLPDEYMKETSLLYPAFTYSAELLRTQSTNGVEYKNRIILHKDDITIVLIQRMNTIFSEKVESIVKQKCTADTLYDCIWRLIEQDTSLRDKLRKDVSNLLKYFAISA